MDLPLCTLILTWQSLKMLFITRRSTRIYPGQTVRECVVARLADREMGASQGIIARLRHKTGIGRTALDEQTFEFEVDPDSQEVGQRLDKVVTERLATTLQLSRVKIQQLIKDGQATVGSKVGKASYHLEAGDKSQIKLTQDG